MSFDASGTFTRTNNVGSTGSTVWQDDAASGIKIQATRHDVHDQDIAGGLSECLTRTGKGVPAVDIPWGGKKIINLANPTALQDAATKNYVDNPAPSTSARDLSGADLNGRLNFTAPSGVNGITWTYANLSWVARHSKAGEGNDRLVLNPSVAPSTADVAGGLADVVVLDDAGRINNNGVLSNNVSYDGAAPLTITPGIGTVLNYSGGNFSVLSNDVATITNNYSPVTPRLFFRAQNSAGTTTITLQKNGTDKYNRIQAMNGSEHRWVMDLGNGEAESSTRTGSNFALYSYDNDGANAIAEMIINRETHKVTFYGEVAIPNLTTTDDAMVVGPVTAGSAFSMQRPITSGQLALYGGQSAATGAYIQLFGDTHASNASDIVLGTESSYRYFFDFSANKHFWANNAPALVMDLNDQGDLSITGQLNFDKDLVSTNIYAVLSAAPSGYIIFRPNGPGSTVGQVDIGSTGDLSLQGQAPAATGGVFAGKGTRGKIGSTGAYGGYFINFNWNGSLLAAYAEASTLGNVSFACDYRIKKGIKPLGSMWEKVKALNPIRYSQRAYEVWVNDDNERWGFAAHELQESLLESAATGVKDGPDVQSPNILALAAALTKALQEAMLRIEALEAA